MRSRPFGNLVDRAKIVPIHGDDEIEFAKITGRECSGLAGQHVTALGRRGHHSWVSRFSNVVTSRSGGINEDPFLNALRFNVAFENSFGGGRSANIAKAHKKDFPGLRAIHGSTCNKRRAIEERGRDRLANSVKGKPCEREFAESSVVRCIQPSPFPRSYITITIGTCLEVPADFAGNASGIGHQCTDASHGMEGFGVSVSFMVGDRVIYTRDKVSPAPGPRAKNVLPSAHGELYSYEVEKFWRVSRIVSPNEVELITRRGKVHTISIHDPRLRRANLWERFWYANRFPELGSLPTSDDAE